MSTSTAPIASLDSNYLSSPIGEDVLTESATTFDVAGFEQLFQRYTPRLLAFATSRVRDPHLAEDAVQETFLRAFRSLDRFDPTRPLLPWLTKICKNICIDQLRQRYAAGEVLTQEDPLQATDERSDPAEQFTAREQAAGMGVALKTLCGRQRRVLVLREIEGWGMDDIAALEDTSLDALKGVLKRARTSFRRSYMAVAAERGLQSVIFAPIGAILSALRSKLHKSTAALKVSSGVAGLSSTAQVLLVTSLVGVTAAAAVTIGGVAEGGLFSNSTDSSPKMVQDAEAVTPALNENTDSALGVSVSTGKLSDAAGPVAEISADLGRDQDEETLNGKLDAKLGSDILNSGSSTALEVKCAKSQVRETACDVVDLLPDSN